MTNRARLQIARVLEHAVGSVRHCSLCNTLTEQALCTTCANPQRDRSKLCVVETPADQAALERTLAYKGLYFVLMGKLSPLDGIGPNDIGLQKLFDRVVPKDERGEALPPESREVRSDPRDQLHGRRRGHGACDRPGAQKPRRAGDAPGARRAGGQRT